MAAVHYIFLASMKMRNYRAICVEYMDAYYMKSVLDQMLFSVCYLRSAQFQVSVGLLYILLCLYVHYAPV